MADEFASPTGINWNGYVGQVQYGSDQNMVVMFYNRAVHDKAKSVETGRPSFKDTIMVRIHPPGERLNIVERPATDADKQRFPVQWSQFSQQREQIPDGTPIDLLYPEHPSIGATLRAHGVHTVEQCAGLSGVAIDEIGMGAQQYCNDAQKYIAASNKGVKASQLRHELEDRDSQIRTLKHSVESLQAEVTRLRQANAQSVDLAQVQALIAGQMARPQFPANPQQLDKSFDVQTAQINATHPTGEIAKGATKKRTRARIAT